MDDHFSHLPKDLADALRSVTTSRLNDGQFTAKLTEEERHGIHAAYRAGVSGQLLAIVFNINRRTITHMVSDTSKSYGPLKRKLQELGEANYIKQYLTSTISDKITSAMQDPEIQELMSLSSKQLAADVAAKRVRNADGPNRRSNAQQGVRTIKVADGLSYRYEIKWLDEHPDVPEASGWFARGLDGSDPEFWSTSSERNDEKTGFWTSVEAYNHIKDNGRNGDFT